MARGIALPGFWLLLYIGIILYIHKVLGETVYYERPKKRIDVFSYMYNVLNDINNVLWVNILHCFLVHVCINDVLSKTFNVCKYSFNAYPSFFSLSIRPSLTRPTLIIYIKLKKQKKKFFFESGPVSGPE